MRIGKFLGMSTRKAPRYKLIREQGLRLTDDVGVKPYDLSIDEMVRNRLDALLGTLVEVANKREGRFDPLFNCLDSIDAIFEFLKLAFPPLLALGVLQPLVDIRAAVQDKVVGAKPPLLDRRIRGLDGRYRHQDEYPDGSLENEEDGNASTRPLRLYRYMQEAVILIAFDALLAGHSEAESIVELRKMIGRFKIRNQDYKPSRPLSTNEVTRWRKAILKTENRPAAARAYSYEHLRELHAAELLRCRDRVEGLRFAEMALDRVRTLQVSDAASGCAG